MSASLRLDGDWTDLTSSLYAEYADADAWADSLTDRLVHVVPQPIVGLQVLRHDPSGKALQIQAFSPNRSARDAMTELAPLMLKMPRRNLRAFYFTRDALGHLPDAMRALPQPLQRDHGHWLVQIGMRGGFAFTAYPVPGVVLTVFALTREDVRLTRAERAAFSRFGLHVEASARLRAQPERVVAVLGANGRVESLRDATDNTRRYAAIQEQTGVPRDAGADGLSVWRALVLGALSVVRRGRHTYFLENPPQRQPLRALTDGEQDVVSMMCQGHSAKAIAYGLGISEATVSARLAAAADKTGLASRMELVRLAAMLTRDPRARFLDTALTTAERDVLELVSQGLTNGEIAARRGRSLRTIANQVSSLLAKTRMANRKALATIVAR